MITKSSVLTNYASKEHLNEIMSKLLSDFDIDFNIIDYDYFDVNDYKNYIEEKSINSDEDPRLIDTLSKVDFLYEIDFGTSVNSIESNYLPSLIDFISQVLSRQLSCDVLTSFKPLSSDEYCPVTYFSKGKEVINFTHPTSHCWKKVLWVKASKD
ncbi:hypothetical protein ACX4EH_004187 [Cronobacter sakazakii]|uniref:hypothetical protein n=1 Tax=Cronobacter sakazakii TaxID=28141 RepID=UPI0029E6921D|nr:hypothetical protein [Cronobacter sakazakii]ELY4104093.1 hypothetical protein [Cronobacter sakazakii]MEB8610336.1 hypothetical protein [Cronobacter sakazakii]